MLLADFSETRPPPAGGEQQAQNQRYGFIHLHGPKLPASVFQLSQPGFERLLILNGRGKPTGHFRSGSRLVEAIFQCTQGRADSQQARAVEGKAGLMVKIRHGLR